MKRYTQANGFKLPTLPAIWRGPQVRAAISGKLPCLQQCSAMQCSAVRLLLHDAGLPSGMCVHLAAPLPLYRHL